MSRLLGLFAGASAFDPAKLPGLQFLYDHLSERRANADGSGSLVTTDGTDMKWWQDRSGNGLHISKDTANFPKAAVVGGDIYTKFTQDALSTPWSPGAISGDYSLHVLKKRDTDSFEVMCTLTGTTGSGLFALPWTVDTFNAPGAATLGRGWPGKTSRFNLFSVVRESGTITYYVNGYPITVDNASNSTTITPDIIQLGRHSTTTYTDTSIASVAFATAAHTGNQVLAYKNWLRQQLPTIYGQASNMLLYLGNSLGTEQYAGSGQGLMTKVSSGGLAPSATFWLNASRGARQGAQMLAEYPTVVLPQMNNEAAPSARKVIFLWEGTNDMVVGGLSGTDAAANTFSLVTALKSNITNCEVVVGTVIDRNATGWSTKKPEYNNLILDAGNQSTYGYSVADFTGIADVSNDGVWSNTTYYVADGVHLKGAGYDLIKNTIGTAIEAAFAA